MKHETIKKHYKKHYKKKHKNIIHSNDKNEL